MFTILSVSALIFLLVFSVPVLILNSLKYTRHIFIHSKIGLFYNCLVILFCTVIFSFHSVYFTMGLFAETPIDSYAKFFDLLKNDRILYSVIFCFLLFALFICPVIINIFTFFIYYFKKSKGHTAVIIHFKDGSATCGSYYASPMMPIYLSKALENIHAVDNNNNPTEKIPNIDRQWINTDEIKDIYFLKPEFFPQFISQATAQSAAKTQPAAKEKPPSSKKPAANPNK